MSSDPETVTWQSPEVTRKPKVVYYVDDSKDVHAPDGGMEAKGHVDRGYMENHKTGTNFRSSTRGHNFRSSWLTAFRTEEAANKWAAERRNAAECDIIKVDGDKLGSIVKSPFMQEEPHALLVLHGIPVHILSESSSI